MLRPASSVDEAEQVVSHGHGLGSRIIVLTNAIVRQYAIHCLIAQDRGGSPSLRLRHWASRGHRQPKLEGTVQRSRVPWSGYLRFHSLRREVKRHSSSRKREWCGNENEERREEMPQYSEEGSK